MTDQFPSHSTPTTHHAHASVDHLVGGCLSGYAVFLAFVVALTLWMRADRCSAQVFLGISNEFGGIHLGMPSQVSISPSGQIYPEYTIEGSQDLLHWRPVGGKVRGVGGLSGSMLDVSLPNDTDLGFYRTLVSTNSETTNETASGGADVYGYNSRFAAQISQLQSMSLADFSSNFQVPPYLSQLDWDPTTAQYWTNFSGNPNFALNSSEFSIFRTNGFVVSERLGNQSFAQVYYQILTADMPVFISADSILHAWHLAYDNILEEMEEQELSPLMEKVITNMALQIPRTAELFGQGTLSNSVQDADFFLTVAFSLWRGQAVTNYTTGAAGAAVAQRVNAALVAVQNASPQNINLFGSDRLVDFSQFVPRGHYTDSPALERYFQAMMWCSLIDLRVATFAPNKEDDIQELGDTIILDYLLQQSGGYALWGDLDQVLRAFVGIPEEMTFPQLESLLAAANIHSPADVPDLATLTNLQTRLLTGELGLESIRSGVFFYDAFSPDLPKLPRSFAVFSQRFVIDAWAFSEVTWPNTAPFRMRSSCLDIAFSVLGNNAVVPEVVARMTADSGNPFRDGLPYQTNLAAVRNVIDSQNSDAWTNNMYNAWLYAIRALSTPTTGSEYPEAMRTHAWAMKNLNTQLASWTELKHDTVLYDTQAYTGDITCKYPSGFVEPRPEFWQAMNTLASGAADALAALPLVSGSEGAQFDFLANFAAQMLTLQDMAERELAQQPFTAEETNMVLNLIELVDDYGGYPLYNGWYPQLYYKQSSMWFQPFDLLEGSAKWDALVADVQTDPYNPNINDPGAVLEEATGNVNLMMIAVDNGPDRWVYAGPVMSHYEFESQGSTRLTDADWQAQMQSAEQSPPDWTSPFLVPK